MCDWAMPFGMATGAATVLVSRWYGRSWRALADELAEPEDHHPPRPPDESDLEEITEPATRVRVR